MQLNMETDYAIRCLMYLARCEESASSLEIGNALMLNRNYVQKILRKLRNAGLLTVTRGSQGGYMLARPASMITMREVLGILEDTMMVSRCLEPDTYCSLRWAGHCGARSFFIRLQNALDECSESISLETLVRAKEADRLRFPGDIFSFIRSRNNKEFLDILEDDYRLEEAALCQGVAEDISPYCPEIKPSGTCAWAVPDSGAACKEESGADTVPEAAVEESGADTVPVPEAAVDENGADTVSEAAVEESGTDTVPEAAVEESGKDTVPEAAVDENGADTIPAETVDEDGVSWPLDMYDGKMPVNHHVEGNAAAEYR